MQMLCSTFSGLSPTRHRLISTGHCRYSRTRVTPQFILIRQKRASHYSVGSTDLTLSYLRIQPKGILNTTKTSLGKALLRTWFLRPSFSLDVIRQRHDTVACFILPENLTAVNSLNGHLKGIKNVPRMLGILKAGRGKATDWQGLVKVCDCYLNPSCTNCGSDSSVYVSLCYDKGFLARVKRSQLNFNRHESKYTLPHCFPITLSNILSASPWFGCGTFPRDRK